MSRFNLENLPRCGAKTRSGGTCKRYGNKINGRCKLHGGRTTGAKTKEGKLAARLNALQNIFGWHFNKRFALEIKPSEIKNAISAYSQIYALSLQPQTGYNHKLIEVVEQYRIELETTKYLFREYEGSEGFLLVQAALDYYYKATAAKHLKFHIYTSVYPAPYFDSALGSLAEYYYEAQTQNKLFKKKGDWYTPPCPLTKHQRKLKKLAKQDQKQNI